MRKCFFGLVIILVVASLFSALPLAIAATNPVTFDFDTGSPVVSNGTGTPFDQASGGLTAHFSSSSDPAAFSVQSQETTFFTLPEFSGKYLYQSKSSKTDLKISFSQPLTDISLTFSTTDYHGVGEVDQPTAIKLTAYMDTTLTGSVTARGSFPPGYTYPQGTLSFSSGGNPFDLIVLELIFQPNGATAFMVDNIVATATAAAIILDAGPDAGIEEGSTLVSAGSFTGGTGPWTATVDYGDGSGVQPLALNGTVFNLNHSYTDNGVYTLTVNLTDSQAISGTDSILVTAGNIAPAVAAGPDVSINEGDTLTGSGSFNDPGADTWTAAADYGDGSGTSALPLNADKTFTLSHLYNVPGIYTVTVTVTDDDNDTGTDSIQVTVGNIAPMVDAGPDVSINEGDTFTGFGSFNDPDAGTWTATVDYGDGSGTSTLPLNADKTFALSHLYTVPGIYTVTATVTDDDNGTGTDTNSVNVAALSGSASFAHSNLIISPDSAAAGEPITIEVTCANNGNATGTHRLTLKVDNIDKDSQEVTLAPGEAKTVTFNLIIDNPGTYSLRVEDLSGSVVVSEQSGNWIWIPVAAGGFLATIGVVFLFLRRLMANH